jgi:hypothetical protein
MHKITAEMISDDLERRFINAILDAGEPFKAEFAALLNAAIEAGLVSPPVTNWERIYKAALNDLYEDYVEDQEAKGNRPAPLQLWIDAAQLKLGKTD